MHACRHVTSAAVWSSEIKPNEQETSWLSHARFRQYSTANGPQGDYHVENQAQTGLSVLLKQAMGMHAGVSQGLLFDWALALLGAQAQGRQADMGTQFWTLVALREGLVAVDEVTLARWAHAVLDACQGLLDAEDTSVHLLAPFSGSLSGSVPPHPFNAPSPESFQCA